MKKYKRLLAVLMIIAFAVGTLNVPKLIEQNSNMAVVEAGSRLKTNKNIYHVCKYQRVRGKSYTGKKKYEKSSIHREIKNFRMCKYYYRYTYKQYFYAWQCSTCKKR